MKLEGTESLETPLLDCWRRINDPVVLRACAPGLISLTESGSDVYDAVLELKLPALSGRFTGTVEFVERHEPERLRLRLRGKGAPGFVEASAEVRLAETDEGTQLRYTAEVQVGGQLARLGQRMISGVTREMAGQFFENLDRYQPGGRTAPPSAIRSFLTLLWRSLLRLLGLRRDS